jgi:hypothetical protein
MTRHGQMVMMGDTMEILFAIEMLIHQGNPEEARSYAREARMALTQMANNWVQSDAAYSVIAKSLHQLPEVLKNDDTEPS